MRTIVDLPDDQLDALAVICDQDGISRAEAVRRALAAMIAERGVLGREEAFGAWGRSCGDGREFVDRLRGEWER